MAAQVCFFLAYGTSTLMTEKRSKVVNIGTTLVYRFPTLALAWATTNIIRLSKSRLADL